jgi:hypothetical protein
VNKINIFLKEEEEEVEIIEESLKNLDLKILIILRVIFKDKAMKIFKIKV